MSNKSIQKKRAKAEMLRDKSKLITAFLVNMYPGATRTEHIEMAKPLFRLSLRELLRFTYNESMRRQSMLLHRIYGNPFSRIELKIAEESEG